MNEQLISVIQKKIEGFITGKQLRAKAIGGGSINETYQLEAGKHSFFCKVNSALEFPRLFEKECRGLALLGKQALISTPAVVACFEEAGYQVLLLEWITAGERTKAFWKCFGEQLAALHQISQERFGLEEDNYMGSVPQQNNLQQDWITFFTAQRLQPMIDRCSRAALLTTGHRQQFEKLYTKLPQLFDIREKPSLLHGDLWSGNFMCDQNNFPVLIDPAVYYGHRSVDLAMTTLFGGFDKLFYEAYHYQFPFPENYKEQWAVCNLYPLLIHLYLFGNSYLPQIERVIKQLL